MLQRLKNISPATFFLWASLCFELLLNVVTPPLQAPDEFNHFYRAYQVSQGSFLPVKKDQRLGGEMPNDILYFAAQYRQCDYYKGYTITYEEIFNSLHINRDQSTRFQDFANTAYYSPVSYMPQAFILFALRQFNASPALLYYAGRWFTFLIWLFIMYAIIRNLPAFKWLFTLLALLPMNLYIVNSFSADTVTNLLSFLFIAVVLRHIYVTPVITVRHLMLMGLLLILLALAKVVYVGLALLLFAIPVNKFKNQYYKVGCLVLLLGISVLTASLWSEQVMQLYIRGSDYNSVGVNEATVSACSDYNAQKKYILDNGTYFPKVVWRSLTERPQRYLFSYIGVLAHLDIVLPNWLYIMAYFAILTVAITEKNAKLNAWQLSVILLSTALVFLLLLLSQHLLWDCVGSGIVELLQGRYLIPVFLLLFMAINYPYIKFNFKSIYIIAPTAILLNVYSCYAIHHRFFTPLPAQVTEIYCDTEHKSGNFYKTSDSNIMLAGGSSQVGNQHHSGGYSAELQPEGYCFTYTFKNEICNSDLVEIEAWQKGDGAKLVVSDDHGFYFAGTFKGGVDESGWIRIKTTCPYQGIGKGSKVSVYAWNPSKQNVFLDDIKIRITHAEGLR